MCIQHNYTIPSANPVAGLPTSASTTTTTETIASTRHITIKAPTATSHGWVFFERAALEATGATCEVMSSAWAVPVSRPNIRPSKAKRWTTTATATAEASVVSTIIGWPWLAASLAWVTAAEVKVAAWPTVPISWLSIHLLNPWHSVSNEKLSKIYKEKTQVVLACYFFCLPKAWVMVV